MTSRVAAAAGLGAAATSSAALHLKVQPTPKKGCFLTLTDALAEATTGSIISIAAGTYVEADLLFTKPNITVQAEGDGVPLITSHGATLQITASVTFVGLAIATDDASSAAVLVASGQPRFTKCNIQSMHVDMDSEPTVEQCTVSGSPHNGILISGNAGGTFRDNTIKNHKGYGVLLNGCGSPHFANNHIAQTMVGPVMICGARGTATFKINNVQDSSMIPTGALADDLADLAAQSAPVSERAAFVITGGASPTLDGNVIFTGMSHGVVVASTWNVRGAFNTTTATNMSEALLQRGGGRTVRRAVAMIPVGGARATPPQSTTQSFTSPLLIRNMIRDNQGAGIVCVGSGVRAACESNNVDSNEKGGVRVERGAALTSKADVVRGHASAAGITVMNEGTTASLTDTIVSEGAEGIRIELRGMVKCTNVTADKLGVAVNATTSATIDCNDCNVLDNDCGIAVSDFGTFSGVHTELRGNAVGAQSTTSGNLKLSHCSLRRNKIAVQAFFGGRGLVESCIFLESSTTHVLLFDRGDPKFLDNTFRDSTCIGITVRKGGRGFFQGNTLSNHKQHTVKIESGGDPTFDRNTFEVSPVELVVIDRHGIGTFTDNTIRSSQRSAILVRSGADPTFRVNVVTGNALAGLEIQDGAGGNYEKNVFRENGDAAVSIRGSATHRAIVALNTIELCPTAIDASDGARALVARNVISNCQIGFKIHKACELAVVRNDVSNCKSGVHCIGEGCRPTLAFNRIHGNTVTGLQVGAGAVPTVWNNTFLGHAECAVDMCDGSGGRFLANVFSMNEVAMSCVRGATTVQLQGNVFTFNRAGVRCTGNAVGGAPRSATPAEPPALQRTNSILGGSAATMPATPSSAPDAAGAAPFVPPPARDRVGPRLIRNTLIRNEVAISLDADSYVSMAGDGVIASTKAGVAVATATAGLHCANVAFVANGRYNCLAFGDAGKGRSNADKALQAQAASGGLRRAGQKGPAPIPRYEHVLLHECYAFGRSAVMAVKNGREDVDVHRCIFMSSVLTIASESSPRVAECVFRTSQHPRPAHAEHKEKKVHDHAFPDLHLGDPNVIGGPIASAIQTASRAKGDIINCIVRSWRAGLDADLRHLDKPADLSDTRGPAFTDCIMLQKATTGIKRTLISGGLSSGLFINHGYLGAIEDCTVFGNAGCGIRVGGRMQAPSYVTRCKVFGHLVPPAGGSTFRARSKSVVDGGGPAEETKFDLPDVTDDDAFTGAEPDTNSKTETLHAPKYTMPNTDGPGVGVLVDTSGALLMSNCEIFASGLCNILVLSKTSSTVERTAAHSSDGYGVVLRPQTHLVLTDCSVVQNTLAGLLAESHCAPVVQGCKFADNGIGAVLAGDDAEFSRCSFSTNRLAGMRHQDGSHTSVADSTVFNNAVGIEVRQNATTAPQIKHCEVFGNVFVGVLCTAGSRPTLSYCRVFDHRGVGGVVARCSASPTFRNCRIERNSVGATLRLFADATFSETYVGENTTGVIAEWHAAGTLTRNIFTKNRSEAVLVRTMADPCFQSNVFLQDSPVVCTTEGKGMFDANTFRGPRTGCFTVYRGGNPIVVNTLFSALRVTEGELPGLFKEVTASVKASGTMTVDMLGSDGMDASVRAEEIARAVTTVFAPIEQSPRTAIGRKTVQVRPDAVRGDSEAALAEPAPSETERTDDDAFIPVKIELGGKGTFRSCVFAMNEPCSLICDGGTTEPLIESCIFYRHRNVAMVVCGQAMPKITNVVFAQNHLGLQMSRTPMILSDCYFLSNTVAVEADAAVTGMITECNFLDDNLSVNVLASSGASVKRCNFYRSDTAIVFGAEAQGFISECRSLSSTETAFVIQSGENRITKIDKCFVFKGRGGIKVTDGANADIVGCEFYEVEKNACHIMNSPGSSVTQCKFYTNGGGVVAEGSDAIPLVDQCTFSFNRIGVECLMRANMTVQQSQLLQNKIGIIVHNDGLGIFKRLELIGNSVGVSFKSGVEGFPTLSHSTIIDCDESAIQLSNHAVGEIVDCQLFDNRLGIYASGSAATLVDNTKLSHPDRKEVAEHNMVVRDGSLVRLLLGPNFQQIFEHSPAFNHLSSRQRKLEQNKAKTQNTQLMDKHDASSLKAERTCRVAVQKVMQSVGLEPMLANIVPAKDPNALNILDYKPGSASPRAPQTVSTAARILEQSAVRGSMFVTVPAIPETGVRPREAPAPDAASGGGIGGVTFADPNVSVESGRGSTTGRGASAAIVLTKVSKKRSAAKTAAAAIASMRNKRQSTFMKPTASSAAAAAVRRVMSSISMASVNSAPDPTAPASPMGAGDPEANIIPETPLAGVSPATPPSQVPLLPPLPPPPVIRPYPRKEFAVGPPNLPPLPMLVPVPPSRVAMQCFANPQHGKFGYSSEVHRDAVKLCAKYNALFADQVLNEFSAADRRRREALSVLDVTKYVIGLANRYGFHPAKYAALYGRLGSGTVEVLRTPDLDESDRRHSLSLTIPGGITIPVVEGPIPTVPPAALVPIPPAAPVDDASPPVKKRDAATPGTSQRSISMMRPSTPIDSAARDFAESAWLSVLAKSGLDEEISLAEFAAVVLDPESAFAPVFRLHFTWMGRDGLATPVAADARRRRKPIGAGLSAFS